MYRSTSASHKVMNRKVSVEECRACLRKVEDEICHELFQVGDVSWASPGAVIATDLAKLAGIEISEYDNHSRFICPECYNRFTDAMSFIMTVRRSDNVLKTRFALENTVNDKEISTWPKPIPTNNSMHNEMDNQMDVQIKQEVLSEDEYTSNCMDEDWEPTMDIKIEPEEFVAPVPPDMFYKSNHSLEGTCEEERKVNGNSNSYEEEFLDSLVKQEPLSSDELEALEALPDLPLDCMLCLKGFQSVTGLKAHVIAQHSYGSVNRNPPTTVPVQKERTNEFVCATCRKSFETRTDLMVHEASHNKHVCYICDAKFNTFRQLTRHGARCRKRHTPLPRSRPTRPQKLLQSKPSPSKEHKDETVLGQVNDLIPIKDIKVEPSEPVISPLNVLNTTDKEPHRQNTVDFIQIFSAPIPSNALRILSIDEDDSSQSKKVTLQNTKEEISPILFPNTADNFQNSRGNSGNTTKSTNAQPITVKQSSNEQVINEQLAEFQQVLIKQENIITSEQPIASKQLSNEQKQPIKLKQKVGEEAKQKPHSNKKREKREMSKHQMEQKPLLVKQEVDKQPMEPKQVSNNQEVGEQSTKPKQVSNKQEVIKPSTKPKKSSRKQEVIEPPTELNKLSNKQEGTMESKQLSNEQEVSVQSMQSKQVSNDQEVNEKLMESEQLSNGQEVSHQPMTSKEVSNKQKVIEPPTELKHLFNKDEVSEQTMESKQLSNEQEDSEQHMKSKQVSKEHEVSGQPMEPRKLSNAHELSEQTMEPKQLSNEQEVTKQLLNKQKVSEHPMESKRLLNTQEVIEPSTELKQLFGKEHVNEQTMAPKQLSNEQEVSEQPMESKQLSNEQENIGQFVLKQLSNNQIISEQLESKPLPCTLEVIGETFKESVLEPNTCMNTQEVNEASPETPILENPFTNDVDGNSNASEDNIPNTSDIKINLEIKTR